mmetsp:Transcript_15486/g.21372  ORF Transcript_15486/g.21372 Transcript_15486/m.21372 type:complete len:92 (+) Transcript_15486:254-529(+)|eukprot:CAMPEP_0196589100 /NCGR_PEP_ID=MMETSP1081-20130531/62723_1 /TAXON_ID=36882 /ORGANISM="Pyramimonas amylifera, Strain CCMP720" /LENGTH=91 /DNA_ID=CAMNT_0041911817 /DNA_START=245 /DNA_END=520 /DNA_ORIENTATION=+
MDEDEWISSQALPTSTEKFVTVQGILDRNKLLINEINANQEAKCLEGLERNEKLIQELNNNIQQVVELYKELSTVLEQSMDPDLSNVMVRQ